MTMYNKTACTTRDSTSVVMRLQRKCTDSAPAALAGCWADCARREQMGLQAKALVMGEAYGVLEHEADRIADQVMAGSGAVPRATAVPLAQPGMQHARGTPAPAGTVPAAVDAALSGTAHPLDAGERAFFESRFAHDFSRVRVRTDPRATRAVQARAFTVGERIVFDAGEYRPDTATGRHLLAHELVHVLQQGEGAAALVQCYRFDKDKPCSSSTVSQIENGHRLAGRATTAAQQLLSRGAPADSLRLWFRYLFGAQAEAQRSAIATNFGKLHEALHEDYVYTCPPAGTRPCVGAEAEVLEDDLVAVCGKQVAGFSHMGMARLLVHENVRRAQGRRSVTNINDSTNGECLWSQRGSEYTEATTDANHPIPYSCFAEKLLAERSHKKKQAEGVFKRLYGPQPALRVLRSSWHGDRTIASEQATVATQLVLNMWLYDWGYLVSGMYQYQHHQRGPVEGEILFGSARIEDRPTGERLRVGFNWREGDVTGGGYWLSDEEDRLKGRWGHGNSDTNGGDWTLQPHL